MRNLKKILSMITLIALATSLLRPVIIKNNMQSVIPNSKNMLSYMEQKKFQSIWNDTGIIPIDVIMISEPVNCDADISKSIIVIKSIQIDIKTDPG